jgi:hypothetical protein
MPPPRRNTTAPASASIDPASVALQERLHELLTRLSATTDWVRHWPDGQDGGKNVDASSSIHVESTSKLIALIRSVLTSIQAVENTVASNAALKERLNKCLIPMDLIELLDHGAASEKAAASVSGGGSTAATEGGGGGGGGLNPDAFSRGLLKEALGQLAGLKRRKLALEMLSLDISQRQRRRQQAAAAAAEEAAEEAAAAASVAAAAASVEEASQKRSRSNEEETRLDVGGDELGIDSGDGMQEPPAKKQHVA